MSIRPKCAIDSKIDIFGSQIIMVENVADLSVTKYAEKIY